MVTRAFLLSLLTRQFLAIGEQIGVRYPGHWLVWEPGVWTVPSASESSTATRLPTAVVYDRPPKGDALCFLLPMTGTNQIRVGRAPDNDVAINDATVSREHVQLTRDEQGRWSARALPSSKPSQLGGAPLSAAQASSLGKSGELQLGNVRLTYLEAGEFLGRLKTEGRKLTG